MIADIFNLVLYQPLYNGLVFLVSVIPFADVGIAVVVLTLLVKTLLFPVSHKSVKAQSAMRRIEPEMRELKEKHKKNKEEQGRKMMELYRRHGINPFSGCLLFLIQVPIIIALYWVFWRGLENGLDATVLYSFVAEPEHFNMKFLGIIDMSGKSVVLAAFAGVSQYFQMKLSMPKFPQKPRDGKQLSMKEEFQRNFSFQMRYGLPVFVFFIGYTISAAVALYWATANAFSIAHELYVRKEAQKLNAESTADSEGSSAEKATPDN